MFKSHLYLLSCELSAPYRCLFFSIKLSFFFLPILAVTSVLGKLTIGDGSCKYFVPRLMLTLLMEESLPRRNFSEVKFSNLSCCSFLVLWNTETGFRHSKSLHNFSEW